MFSPRIYFMLAKRGLANSYFLLTGEVETFQMIRCQLCGRVVEKLDRHLKDECENFEIE